MPDSCGRLVVRANGKLPETSNSIILAKRTGIHGLQIIMMFLVEFG